MVKSVITSSFEVEIFSSNLDALAKLIIAVLDTWLGSSVGRASD